MKGIEALHPNCKSLAKLLLEKSPYKIRITETFRTAATQKKYFNQGRISPGSIITNADELQSYHQYGLAFDIAFEGNYPYPKEYIKWKAIGEFGEKLGLIWGGRFNDNPHFEYHSGFTWKEFEEFFKGRK